MEHEETMLAPPPGGTAAGDQRAVKRYRMDDSLSPQQPIEPSPETVMDFGAVTDPHHQLPTLLPVPAQMDDPRREQYQEEAEGNDSSSSSMPTLQLPPAAAVAKPPTVPVTIDHHGRFEHLAPFSVAAPEAMGGGHDEGGTSADQPPSAQHHPLPAHLSLDQHPYGFAGVSGVSSEMDAGEGGALSRRTASMDESLALHRATGLAGVGVVSVRKSSFSFAHHRSNKSLLVREDKHGAYLGDAGDVDDGGTGYVDDGFDWEEARQAIGTASPQKAPVSFSIGGINSAFDRSFDEMAGMIAANISHPQPPPAAQPPASSVANPPVSLSPQRQTSGGSTWSADGLGFPFPTSTSSFPPIPPPSTSSPPQSPVPPPQPPSHDEEEGEPTVWERIGADFQAVLPDMIVGGGGGGSRGEKGLNAQEFAQRLQQRQQQQQQQQYRESSDEEDEKEDEDEEEGVSHLSTTSSVSSSDHTVLRRQHQQEQQATLVWTPGWGEGTLERVVAVTCGGRAAALSRWSAEEAARFEEGLRWYRKNFHVIQRKYLPSKSVKEIVARFYDEHKRSPGYRAWKEDKLLGRRILLRQKRPMWKGGGWEEIKGTIRSCERDEEEDELLDVDYDDGRVGRLYRYEAEVLLLGPGDEPQPPPPPKTQEHTAIAPAPALEDVGKGQG